MEERETLVPYEPPAVVEVGEFSEETLGSGFVNYDLPYPLGLW